MKQIFFLVFTITALNSYADNVFTMPMLYNSTMSMHYSYVTNINHDFNSTIELKNYYNALKNSQYTLSNTAKNVFPLSEVNTFQLMPENTLASNRSIISKSNQITNNKLDSGNYIAIPNSNTPFKSINQPNFNLKKNGLMPLSDELSGGVNVMSQGAQLLLKYELQ